MNSHGIKPIVTQAMYYEMVAIWITTFLFISLADEFKILFRKEIIP